MDLKLFILKDHVERGQIDSFAVLDTVRTIKTNPRIFVKTNTNMPKID